MKTIMISIRPEWVKKILNGEKTIEIRKTMPKCELPIKVYIYCTKCKDTKMYTDEVDIPLTTRMWMGNGKVVAEFTLKQIDLLEFRHLSLSHTNAYIPVNENADYEWEKHCCVDYDNVVRYGKLAPLYAWHIDDLKIFDEPKELGEFTVRKIVHKNKKRNIIWVSETLLQRPPQSWCYVKELEGV